MAVDDQGFETGFGGKGGEEAGVALADSKACGEGVCRAGRLDGRVAKGDDVVCDVVVEPGEDGTSLVGEGGKRGGELRGEPVQGWDSLAREFGSVSVGGRKVSANKARCC